MGSVEDERPRIPEFYAGRSLLVTGFSGYMGKLLVEKLLWSCPDVHRVYVLVRGKRGRDFRHRFEKILNSDVFVRLREQKKEELEKILPLEGDVTLHGLGLTEQQRSLLVDQVSIVFHCAASVKFDDPLPLALDVNVKGTKTVVELALEMSKLVSFVHVSTAYSNCDHFVVEERVYPARADWRKTLDIREKIDSAQVNILSQKYMNHMPNTYVFTKSLGEQIVTDHSDRLPVVIFRPSIVVAAWEEPFSGWMDNLNGPGGLGLGTGAGVVRTILLDTDVQPDFMPVDLAIRGLLITAYIRHYKRKDGVHLYNWCAQERSITYSELTDFGQKIFKIAPSKYLLWRPTNCTTTSSFLFYVYFLLFQLLPAFFIDLLLRIVGKRPMLWKLQMKVFVAMRAVSHFTLNYFHFDNREAVDARLWIPEKDMAEFDYLKKPDQEEVFQYLLAATRFVQRKFLKMEPHDCKPARTVNTILTVVDRTVKAGLWLWLLYTVHTLHLVPKLVHSTLHFILDI